MVLWDLTPRLGVDEEEPTEQVQMSSINFMTRSKGLVVDERLVLPKTKKMKENLKKILSTTQTPPKFNLKNTKEINPLVNKHVKVVINKTETVKKGMVQHDMGYDIMEDIKKTKANISLFELCNLFQQRKKFLEYFDPRPSSSSEDIEPDK